jgi:hypothetical protein
VKYGDSARASSLVNVSWVGVKTDTGTDIIVDLLIW